jgi:hypothetical protein
VSITVVAVVAAWNSYWHMVSVALRGHQDPFLAYSRPFSIDGMILVATLAVAEDKAHGRRPRGWARFAFWLGASVSVAANIASVVVRNGLDTLSIAVSAWPPVALLVVVEIMAKPGKPNGKPVPEADPQVPTPLPPPAVQLPPCEEEETNTTESDGEWPTTIGELRPADVAAVAGLIRPAIEAATELGAQGQTLSRDTLSDRLREAGYAISNARASTLLKIVKATLSPGVDGLLVPLDDHAPSSPTEVSAMVSAR